MKKLYPKKVNIISWIILLVGAFVGMCGVSIEVDVLIFIGILIMLSQIIFRLIFYRCPHCGYYLGRDTDEYCTHCGEKVNE